jgi:hypothetical protein
VAAVAAPARPVGKGALIAQVFDPRGSKAVLESRKWISAGLVITGTSASATAFPTAMRPAIMSQTQDEVLRVSLAWGFMRLELFSAFEVLVKFI